MLLKIFRDQYSDDELRMTAFVVICDSNPSPAVFKFVIDQLQRENSNNLWSFVESYIKGLVNSKYPCDVGRYEFQNLLGNLRLLIIANQISLKCNE